jgi:hypothetical protein
MTNEERRLLLLSLEVIQNSLNDLEWKARAVQQALKGHPEMHAEYRRSLEAARKEKLTVVAETVAALRRELDQSEKESE